MYEPIHPSDTLDKYLDQSKHLGPVVSSAPVQEDDEDLEETERQDRIARKPLLSQCYNLFDFEVVAKRVMRKTSWAYYASAADNEIVRRHMLS